VLPLGDLNGAREIWLQVLAVNERGGSLYDCAVVLSNLAEMELGIGDAEAALAHAQRGVRLLEQSGTASDLPDALKNLAQAQLAMGDASAAIATGVRAMELARQGGGRVYLGETTMVVAKICAEVVTGEADEDAKSAGRDAAQGIQSALEEDFDEPALRETAEKVRAVLGEAGLG